MPNWSLVIGRGSVAARALANVLKTAGLAEQPVRDFADALIGAPEASNASPASKPMRRKSPPHPDVEFSDRDVAKAAQGLRRLGVTR
jgi:hypothetical protein